MRLFSLSLFTLGAAAVMTGPLMAQSVDSAATSPCGGAAITFGELANSSGSAPLSPSSICPSLGNPRWSTEWSTLLRSRPSTAAVPY